MANQGVAYGLSAQVKKKLNEKRDPNQEQEAIDWIEAILGEKLDSSKSYEDNLRSGVLLCKVMNKLQPGIIKKINENSTMPFKIMENINAFQEAIKKYGVPITDVFQTVDLYEKKDIAQVTQTLFALGRTCQVHPEYNGPILGPKLAMENKRGFTQEDIKRGSNIIGLQMGTNQGASQSGMTFGKQRMIND